MKPQVQRESMSMQFSSPKEGRSVGDRTPRLLVLQYVPAKYLALVSNVTFLVHRIRELKFLQNFV